MLGLIFDCFYGVLCPMNLTLPRLSCSSISFSSSGGFSSLILLCRSSIMTSKVMFSLLNIRVTFCTASGFTRTSMYVWFPDHVEMTDSIIEKRLFILIFLSKNSFVIFYWDTYDFCDAIYLTVLLLRSYQSPLSTVVLRSNLLWSLLNL